MPNVIGGFQDLEQQANEAGYKTAQNNQQNNNNLSNNPYLSGLMPGGLGGPGEIKITRAGEAVGQTQTFATFETKSSKPNLSAGTMPINESTMSVEFRIQKLKEELNISVVEGTEGQSHKETKSDEKKAPAENKAKKQAENLGKFAYTRLDKTRKSVWGIFKDIFGAFKEIYKAITFKIYTPEQKKKMDEDKKKAAERGAVKSGFFQKIEGNARNLLMENMKKLNELEDRLMITGMSTEQRNRYLGRRRNMSYAERNTHLAHFIARAVQEEQAEQAAKEKEVKTQQLATKKSGMDLNKVAEGGSLLSSTGGQGAG